MFKKTRGAGGKIFFNVCLKEQEEQEGVNNESYEKNEDELQSEFDEDDYRKTFINKYSSQNNEKIIKTNKKLNPSLIYIYIYIYIYAKSFFI